MCLWNNCWSFCFTIEARIAFACTMMVVFLVFQHYQLHRIGKSSPLVVFLLLFFVFHYYLHVHEERKAECNVRYSCKLSKKVGKWKSLDILFNWFWTLSMYERIIVCMQNNEQKARKSVVVAITKGSNIFHFIFSTFSKRSVFSIRILFHYVRLALSLSSLIRFAFCMYVNFIKQWSNTA